MMITGPCHYARITGEAPKTKFSPRGQWSIEISLDGKTKQRLLEAGMKKDYIKNKGDDRGDYLQFTRDAVKKDGKPGKPIEVVGPDKAPWPEDKLIGNGSIVNAIISLNEREWKGEKFLKPGVISIQVWEHVPYERGGFPTKEETSDMGTPKEEASW